MFAQLPCEAVRAWPRAGVPEMFGVTVVCGSGCAWMVSAGLWALAVWPGEARGGVEDDGAAVVGDCEDVRGAAGDGDAVRGSVGVAALPGVGDAALDVPGTGIGVEGLGDLGDPA